VKKKKVFESRFKSPLFS
jgi:hypothetical protein